ncbi:MAG: Photosystem I reaction center subunit III [Hydrococcus sp. C42_A2020_068]|uniref:Photosystem I reaction center subunit III n=1 Tax=Hydrococcus rivularis NIES-593 TaxID=1921803 RepID=A0A1U7HEP4_9CYAN|nr:MULTISPECIES: photosystem I reaction centre subunit III [Pleurocapsales]AFY75933.1 Photosystem I reaction centre subunit III [Pleurocapsa sp. PCC 7327]MBF2021804.1 Photosystem I reaction center subunit III [Hydrococcus sp. C42_A2020_068]OKH22072.1 Photosystem I reaction center subunit III [Hydrococcus rivularis NIES-593]
MKHLLALILIVTLWFNFAPPASADGSVAGLTPCSETPAFKQKSKNFLNTTADPKSGQKRAERYAQALCGPEGYPHLIVDGRWDHMGDFFIPSILFLYIAGQIGWAGRAYLIAIRDEKDAEMKEIIIDVPLALKQMIAAFAWPLLAVKEFLAGTLTAKDSEIPVSPR